MKFYKLYILFIAIVGATTACKKDNGDDPKPLTEIEKIAKTWQVSKVFMNGQEDTSGSFSSFSITFNANNGNATTYTVTPGNAIDTPNQTPNNQGVWALTANNTQIILDSGTDNEIVVEIEAVITENSLIISWKVPKEIDKTEPSYRLELIPL